MTTTSHTLYRFFDKSGQLLYVGRTINPGRRWRDHEKTKPWFDAVASLTREVHESAEAVDLAERTAIATESPMCNIALNPGARRVPPAALTPAPDPTEANAVTRRWAALQLDAEEIAELGSCLGDETVCECSACHNRRLAGFEDIRAKYDWHPDLMAELQMVEEKYYAGHWLSDWYYDFFDIEMFARGRLVEESTLRALPAYVDLGEQIATVDCPFCFRTHRHLLTAGMPIDRPLDAGCESQAGGRYVVFDDWMDVQEALSAWGEASAKVRAA